MAEHPPLNLPLAIGDGWRRRVKAAVGSMLALVLPGRVRQLHDGLAHEPFSRIDRLLIAALVHRAMCRGGSLDHLAYLHRNMWQGDAAMTYHAAVEDRFTNWFLPHHVAVVEALERDLAGLPVGRFHTLCEIGTGSGVALDFLQRRLAARGITTCIGLDLSAKQVEVDAVRFPTCRFFAADATTWIPDQAQAGWIIFCCGGVLEYFPRATLERLIAQTVDRCVPVRWVVVEPIALEHDQASDTTSRVFGFEATWSHPYAHLMRQGGLQVLYEHEQQFDGTRWKLLIAGN